MTILDKARELVRIARETTYGKYSETAVARVATALQAADDAGYARGIEAAALKVAAYVPEYKRAGANSHAKAADLIAEQILMLKEPKP